MSASLYRVQIGWAGRNAGVARVGSAKVAPATNTLGYDRIGYEFTPSYSGLYDDLSGTGRFMCEDFEVVRGRDDEFSNIVVGTATINLNDILPGRYNPRNATSPLYGLIRPMRPCRIQGSLDAGASYYDLFHGWLDEGQDDPDFGANKATFHFKDLFLWLERAKNITIPNTGPIFVGDAIALIHDAINWTNPAKRSFQKGTLLPNFSLSPGKSGLAAIGEMLEVDLGQYFISRSGVATYYDRYEVTRRASIGTIQAAQSVVPGIALANVRNEITVTRQYPDVLNPGQFFDGVPQYFQDNASVDEFGDSAWNEIKSPYLDTDAMAMGLAQYRVAKGKEPVDPMWQYVVSEGPTGYLALMLQADLMERVSIQAFGNTTDHHVQKITHNGASGVLHKTKWILSERAANQAALVGRAKVAPNDPALWTGYDRVPY